VSVLAGTVHVTSASCADAATICTPLVVLETPPSTKSATEAYRRMVDLLFLGRKKPGFEFLCGFGALTWQAGGRNNNRTDWKSELCSISM
jgi:hypothetical protein